MEGPADINAIEQEAREGLAPLGDVQDLSEPSPTTHPAGIAPGSAHSFKDVELGTPGQSKETTAPGFADLIPAQTNMTARSGGKPYSSLTNGQKWAIVSLAALAGFFSPIGTNIVVPAIPTLAEAFSTSEEKINLTVTVYLVFQAVTPAIFGSAADCFGRRPVYVVCLAVFIASCIGTALCPTSDYWLFMLMRVIQSSGGSPMIAIGNGVIADIALPAERGKYLGVFQLGPTIGPAFGPVLGGVLAFTLGWRSIFWFLLIASAICLVIMILLYPETLRALVGDGSLPPPLLNCTPGALLRRRKNLRQMSERGESDEVERSHRPVYKPWASIVLLLEPDLALLFIWSTLFYSLWYAMLTVFSTILKDKYGVNEIILGLAYIPNGVGSGLSAIITGRLMDRYYQREKRRVGGDHRLRPETFRLERTRFIALVPTSALLLVSCTALGWAMEARAPIAVPIVLNFFVGFATGFLTCTTIYAIDLFPGQGGAVTATFNLVRCIGGAISVSLIQIQYRNLGAGWSFVLLSGICLLGTPIPLVVLRYGPGWRMKRIKKAKERAARLDG